MENRKNNLWDVDKILFTSMVDNYVSPEEANFFKTMQFKEEYEPALANDIIMSEHSNSDNIYIVRELYDEYLVGKGDDRLTEIHTMNLSEALNLNLHDAGLLCENITLLEWLRTINYQGVTFDNNFDLMQ
jgi:hypothetical protein